MLEDEKFCRLIIKVAEYSVTINKALSFVVERYEQVKLDISAAKCVACQLAAEERGETEACRAELNVLHRTRRMLMKPTHQEKGMTKLR